MRFIRRLFVISCLVLVAILVWAGIYARKQGFTNSWKAAIENELASHGYYVQIKKLTLGAFRGLVAEDVTFFKDERRTESFAKINDIYLDVELDRVLQKQISINTLDIQNGQLTIPLNPKKPNSGKKLLITELSGRVALTESRIEIVRVEANLAGLDVFLKGSLLRHPNHTGKINQAGKEALEATVSKIQSLKKLIDVLDTFAISDGETNPSLKIDFRGDLRDLSTTTATAELVAGQFRKKGTGYNISSLTASAEYDGRVKQLTFPRVELLDQAGSLNAEGLWDQKTDEIQFDLTSSADLDHLAALFFPGKKWGEVVPFQPPFFRAKGAIDLDMLKSPRPPGLLFPGHILGEFATERFVITSGVIFNSSRGDFSIKGDKFYVRNFQVDHKTGAAFLNCKFEPGQGRNSLQFQSVIKLDPRIFAPFFQDEGTRKFLSNWHFSDSSGVDLAAAGQCSDLRLQDLEAKGNIYLRDFRLNRVPFDGLKADFEIDGPKRWYRNVKLTRDDGEFEAELASTDTSTRQWEIKGGRSTLGLEEAISAFSPKLKGLLAPYRFTSPPTIKIQGLIDARSGEQLEGTTRQTKLDISFSSDSEARYNFLGQELVLDSPGGKIRLEKDRAHVRNLRAGLYGGSLELEFDAPHFRAENATYDASISVRDGNLKELGELYQFKNEAVGKLSGTMHFSGQTGQADSVNGHGGASIANQDLFQLPILNQLEPLLEIAAKPGEKTPEVKGRASTSFSIKNGVFTSRVLKLAPRNVAMTGSAVLNFPGGTLEAELKRSGAAAGKRYVCRGTISDPQWKVEGPPAPAILSKRQGFKNPLAGTEQVD